MKPDKLAELLQMCDSGMPALAIATELEVSIQSVRNALRSNGRTIVVESVHLKDEAAIVTEYITDEPVPNILYKFGLSYTTLYAILRRNNIPTRQVVGEEARKDRLSQAVQMYKDNVVIWRIKQETGIAQPTLHNELHRLGIPLRRQRMAV